MLTKGKIADKINDIFMKCPGNEVQEKDAICSEVIGIKFYDLPLVGIGSSKDDLFEEFKSDKVIGPWFMTPTEWLPEAKTVISLFFPFTEEVKESNRKASNGPSPAWLHGRIEGQEYIASYITLLSEWFNEQDIKNCAPTIDTRFMKVIAGNSKRKYECINEHTFGSNWSERHAAYVCGLGTFGLSKGLITKKGMAGRFVSIIIENELEPDERSYNGIYDYCTMCGACIKRCPVNAISLEFGKKHNPCYEWLGKMAEIYAPRIGCGLCQTKVPCESSIPSQNETI